ncbi:MAG: rfaQ [Chthoniobacteraceae bacterium]|nr:rfaQ [Chthoniobacteraceae bacterium]
MRILVLQLKRIGDLVLTAPALAELRRQFPTALITLAVTEGCAALLPALPAIDRTLVFKKNGVNPLFWKQLLFTKFDVCLDFTGNDRSAFFTVLSKASERVGFAKNNGLRALVYNRLIDSSVRDHHTVDHYLHLLRALECHRPRVQSALFLPDAARKTVASLLGLKKYVVIHPGTARVEKYWESERWAAVITHIRKRHGLECVITGGADAFESAHIAAIQAQLETPCIDLSGKIDLLTFAAVIAQGRACLSCDTAAVHLAAAFLKPQLALYGLTNPFHWRPRHPRAVIISAAHPETPLIEFQPRMKGAPMSAISTELVLSAIDALLAEAVSSNFTQ